MPPSGHEDWERIQSIAQNWIDRWLSVNAADLRHAAARGELYQGVEAELGDGCVPTPDATEVSVEVQVTARPGERLPEDDQRAVDCAQWRKVMIDLQERPAAAVAFLFRYRRPLFEEVLDPFLRRAALAQATPLAQGGQPDRPGLITTAAAAQRYEVTPRTIQRRIAKRDLRDHREKNAPRNAPILVDEREVANIWPLRPRSSTTK